MAIQGVWWAALATGTIVASPTGIALHVQSYPGVVGYTPTPARLRGAPLGQKRPCLHGGLTRDVRVILFTESAIFE